VKGSGLHGGGGWGLAAVLAALLLGGCHQVPWNDPYPASQARANWLYGSFSERPKHLDPARSYNSNEYAFIGQIYEPPLQYHFLQRPYRLIPQTLVAVPVPVPLDAQGHPLPVGAPAAQVAYTDYLLRLRPGIRYQPHPALARGADGRYLYHHLSPGQIAAVHTLADFPHTGTREVTAADYAYEIKRMALPSVHCPIAGVLGEYILGFREAARAMGAAERAGQGGGDPDGAYLDLRRFPMEGVQVLDRCRLRIRLKGRYPQFLYWMAMPFFAPVPWEADRFYRQPGLERRNLSLDWYPLGSGPFMLTENNPNLRMVLARNPNFHGATYPTQGEPGDAAAGLLRDAGRPLPFIDRAVYSLEKEDIPYWSKFLQGYYDTSGITSDSFDQAVRFNDQGEAGLSDAMRVRGISLSTAVETSVFYLGFNMADPVVGGTSERARLLRRAIAVAVDFEEYISIFSNGRGVSAQGPIPPGIFGNRAAEGDYNPYVYDRVDGRLRRKPIAAARALLAQAGYPDGQDRASGRPLVLYFDTTASGPDDKARLSWMRKQLDRLGVQLVIRATDYNRFQEKMRKGDDQLFMWGWNADYPDPENFLFLLYGPNGKVEHDGENACNYDNPQYNALFERMKAMDDTPERQAIIDRMVAILRRDAPWAGGFYPKAFALSHAWVHNLKPNLMANNTLKYRRIDPQLRARRRREWNPPVLWPLGLAGGLLLVSALPAYLGYRQRERRTAR
jgi:peptide/nickel transport system substrate-binding protein